MSDGRRVFISYTSELARDVARLGNFVEAAERGANAAGFVYSHMRDFNASHQPPAQVCRNAVSSCDIFVGLVGFRHGSQVPALVPARSYVQLEFDTARGRGMPCLVFLLDENAPVPHAVFFDPPADARQEAFRRHLQTSGLTTSRFTTPDGLQSAVRDSLLALGSPAPPRPPAGPRGRTGRAGRSGLVGGLAGLAVLAAVVLLVVYVALPAVRGTSFWVSLFGDSSKATERLAQERSSTTGSITLTVTSVAVAGRTTRVGITVTNHSGSSATLPVFGTAQLVESGGTGHEADQQHSSWPENVGPGQTVMGTIVFSDPIASSTTSVDVGFSTVFGILGDPSTNGVYVRHVPLTQAGGAS